MSTNKCCKSAVILVLNDTMHYLIVHEFSWAELAMENITAKQRISSTLLVWFSWAITAIRKNLRHSLYSHVDTGSCKRGLRSQCQRGDVVPGNICPLQSWAPLEKRILKYLKLLLNFALGKICILIDSFLKQQFFPILNSSTWKFLTLRWRPVPVRPTVRPEMVLCKDGQRNIQASVGGDSLEIFLMYI